MFLMGIGSYGTNAPIMNWNQFRNMIIANLDDEFLSREWFHKKYDESEQKVVHATFGHCYLATEVAYHLLGGKEAGWKPFHLKQDGESHWFLKHDSGFLLDITAEQFGTAPINYGASRGKGFLTKAPSKRAKLLMLKIKNYLGKNNI